MAGTRGRAAPSARDQHQDAAGADLAARVDAAFDEAVDTRRALHRNPELSWEEHATTALIRERMRGLGFTEVPASTPTGAVFRLQGGRAGRAVLLRADIDALPLDEEVDVDFRSAVPGVMHACGHDAHTSILLGTARLLAERAEELPGSYALVFQPAEEALGGAASMIDGGILDEIQPERVAGLHVASRLATGLVATRPGVAMARAQWIGVRLRGAGGHGALTGTEGNVVLAAAALAPRLGGVVAGMEFEEVPCACSAAVIHAGTAANVVPREAVIRGSLRTFEDAQHALALERLRSLAAEVEAEYTVRLELELPAPVPAVVNDAAATAVWRAAATRVLGEARVLEMPPSTPSDDVSEFLRRVPGCFFFVGAAPGAQLPPMHHSPDFAIDETALRVGMITLTATAIDLARS